MNYEKEPEMGRPNEDENADKKPVEEVPVQDKGRRALDNMRGFLRGKNAIDPEFLPSIDTAMDELSGSDPRRQYQNLELDKVDQKPSDRSAVTEDMLRDSKTTWIEKSLPPEDDD